MKRMLPAVPAALLVGASACQYAGIIEGEAPSTLSAASEVSAALQPLLAPGAAEVVPLAENAMNIDELRVWPIPLGGQVVQLASVLFSGTVSTCATHALICADGTIKAHKSLSPGKPSHLPMSAAGSGSRLLMALPGRPSVLFDAQACSSKDAPDVVTLVPQGSGHILGRALAPDTYVVASSTEGSLHMSLVAATSDAVQTTSTLPPIATGEPHVAFPVFVREYEVGKIEVLYRNSYGGLFYARSDAAAPLPVVGLHWPDIAGTQSPVYRDDVRATDSGALLISVDESTRLDLQTSNKIWRWDPATPQVAAVQIATAPEPPTGFAPWQHAYGWGSAIAENSIPNPDEASLKIPTGYTARTFLPDLAYATASIPLTPCAADAECRRHGESTLLGVAGWGDHKVAFYRVWAWREERHPEAGTSAWLHGLYAAPVP